MASVPDNLSPLFEPQYVKGMAAVLHQTLVAVQDKQQTVAGGRLTYDLRGQAVNLPLATFAAAYLGLANQFGTLSQLDFQA
jgi:hypothetical protein